MVNKTYYDNKVGFNMKDGKATSNDSSTTLVIKNSPFLKFDEILVIRGNKSTIEFAYNSHLLTKLKECVCMDTIKKYIANRFDYHIRRVKDGRVINCRRIKVKDKILEVWNE